MNSIKMNYSFYQQPELNFLRIRTEILKKFSIVTVYEFLKKCPKIPWKKSSLGSVAG